MFSARLFLNVPAVLSENWDLNDLSLLRLLPRLPELSEPLRRRVGGPVPLSFKSASSKTHKKFINDGFVYLSFLFLGCCCFFFFVFFFGEEAIFPSFKDALHLILFLRDFEFQSSHHITRKKGFLPLGTSENNYRKIYIPGMFSTLPLRLFAFSKRARTILCSLNGPWPLKIGLASLHGSLVCSKRRMHSVPWNLKLSKLPYFFCVASDSVIIVLEEALCSIEFGGLRRTVSAEASGGLRGLCRL